MPDQRFAAGILQRTNDACSGSDRLCWRRGCLPQRARGRQGERDGGEPRAKSRLGHVDCSSDLRSGSGPRSRGETRQRNGRRCAAGVVGRSCGYDRRRRKPKSGLWGRCRRRYVDDAGNRARARRAKRANGAHVIVRRVPRVMRRLLECFSRCSNACTCTSCCIASSSSDSAKACRSRGSRITVGAEASRRIDCGLVRAILARINPTPDQLASARQSSSTRI